MTTFFDQERKGTGTAEWAEENVNITVGCRNDCLYCYAAHNANRFGRRPRAEWSREELTGRAEMTSYPARNGVIMFPSAHDITPFNLAAYTRVAGVILKKGNRLLIVSKPRLDCIRWLLSALEPFREQILFRYTIGTTDPETAAFWEPGAPPPAERIQALHETFAGGFHTSVSIEPFLGGIDHALNVVRACELFVTDTIWIGKMNQVNRRLPDQHRDAGRDIRHLQRDEEIMRLYELFRTSPLIRWKDSIKEVIASRTRRPGSSGGL